jgi:uroporphyrinogen-III synthase
LAGRSVVVTRTRAQASGLVDRLVSRGAEVVELPVIAIAEAPDGGAALAEAADRLVAGRYRWTVFTSTNAVTRLLAALGGRGVPSSVRWAVVGVGTARALTEGGIVPDLVPEVSVAEALADAFPRADPGRPGRPEARPDSAAVLFPRAEAVRGGLVPGLRAKGWTVDEVVAYRTGTDDPDPAAIDAAGRADAVAFTSSSTVERCIGLLGRGGVPPVIATIGPITSASVRGAGLEVAAEAQVHSIDGLVEAVVAALGGAGHQAPLIGGS